MIPARLLEDLSAAAPRTRELAAAGLGDLLRSPGLDPAGTRQAVTRLVTLVGTEQDNGVLEQVLSSINEAAVTLPLALVAPIADRMPALDAPLLEYALNILAATYDPAAIPTIEAYLRHPDPQVRAHATEARSELPAGT